MEGLPQLVIAKIAGYLPNGQFIMWWLSTCRNYWKIYSIIQFPSVNFHIMPAATTNTHVRSMLRMERGLPLGVQHTNSHERNFAWQMLVTSVWVKHRLNMCLIMSMLGYSHSHFIDELFGTILKPFNDPTIRSFVDSHGNVVIAQASSGGRITHKDRFECYRRMEKTIFPGTYNWKIIPKAPSYLFIDNKKEEECIVILHTFRAHPEISMPNSNFYDLLLARKALPVNPSPGEYSIRYNTTEPPACKKIRLESETIKMQGTIITSDFRKLFEDDCMESKIANLWRAFKK
jgi:TATA-box binding protein (TBP) (component of TFIID and TFIIIB)